MINLITTTPAFLNLLSSLTVLTLLTKLFVFNNINEPFKGLNELGIVFEGLMASILASHIFYLVVVHLKEQNDKKTIYPHIIQWSRRVVADCISQLKEFEKTTGVKLDFESLKEADLNSAMSKIHPRGQAPMVLGASGQHASWMQFLESYRLRTKGYLTKILSQIVFLEADIVSRITKIDECNHFYSMEMIANIPIGNKDLSNFSKSFFEYYQNCLSLNYLIDSKYSNYERNG